MIRRKSILTTFSTFIFENSVVRNISSTNQPTALLYVDEHAEHAHTEEDGGKEIEQINIVFSDIDQTVVEVNGATIHESINTTCK